ncbi:Bromodomain-containing protein [Globomyces pollinis-pini]|nr:Bromodomain-containing protein [Globomyces pollinis-pini]KAJ2991361.1 hypothetical protein HDV02_003839 [Globomyces sp. JEL0801]
MNANIIEFKRNQKKLNSLLASTKRHPSAIPFLLPVDPINHGCNDYFEKIKNPMDLHTIAIKLNQNTPLLSNNSTIEEYELYGVQQFINDIVLIISNCYQYNPVDHEIRKKAKQLAEWFDSHVRSMFQGILIDWEGFGITDLEFSTNQKRSSKLVTYDDDSSQFDNDLLELSKLPITKKRRLSSFKREMSPDSELIELQKTLFAMTQQIEQLQNRVK